MRYFLLVFDRSEGRLVEEVVDFSDPEAALSARFRREHTARDNPDIEVVVLGAQSREDLEKTHSRYFGSVGQLKVGS